MESGHFLHNHNTKDDRTIADEAKNQDVNCFLVDDLLDFSNDEIAGFIGDGSTTEDDQSKYWQQSGSSAYSSPKTTTGSNVSPPPEIDCSFKLSDNHLDNFENLCIPGDDLGELEWLSNFVEDAFSAKEAIPIGGGLMTFVEDGHLTTCYSNSNEEFIACNQQEKERKEIVFNVPGRARSKRSRIPACDLSSRRISIAKPYSPPPTTPQNIEVQYGFVSMPEQEHQQFVEVKKTKPAKYPSSCSTSSSSSSSQIMFQDDFQHRASEQNHHHHHQGPMRKCTHCETTQTPQWRAGPKGPKTLCNACGVRFKSGRLVPEYRPASSPTFVPSKHSNSHRKVMEMRRHKEVSVFHHVRSKPIATSSIKYSPSNEYHRRDNNNDQFSSWFAGGYNDDESYLLPTKHDYRQLVL